MNNYLQNLIMALKQGSGSADNTNGQANYGANTGAFGSANMFNQAAPTNQPFWAKKPQTNAWANGAPNPQAYTGLIGMDQQTPQYIGGYDPNNPNKIY